MILLFLQQIDSAQVILQNASSLAQGLKKNLTVLYIIDKEEIAQDSEFKIQELLHSSEVLADKLSVVSGKSSDLQHYCDELDASFLLIQCLDERKRAIQNLLYACRALRIPYLLHKPTFQPFDFTKVILPVGFLEEEMEKTQFAAAFGRFFNAEVLLLLANDYGSKAAVNADKMQAFFSKFSFKVTLQKAKSDSFGVEKESLQLATLEDAGLVLVSASREYGLDDLIFGPNELHIIRSSKVPILLVNPRGDLYALCD